MSIVETESTPFTLLPLDRFTWLSNDQTLIQNLPMFINIRNEISYTDDECYYLIKPTASADYSVDNLMNVETETADIQDANYDGIEIFKELSLSARSDAEDSIQLDLSRLSTPIIKHEPVDIKVETHATDSAPSTLDLETSLKDENRKKLKDLRNASRYKYLRESRNNFCNICVKVFTTPKNLQRHCEEVHLKNNSYPCKICDKTFFRKDHLKRHEKLHSKNWKCNICGQFFNYMRNLKSHKKNVHFEIENWKCNLCDKSFKYKCNLRRHEKRNHLKIKK